MKDDNGFISSHECNRAECSLMRIFSRCGLPLYEANVMDRAAGEGQVRDGAVRDREVSDDGLH